MINISGVTKDRRSKPSIAHNPRKIVLGQSFSVNASV